MYPGTIAGNSSRVHPLIEPCSIWVIVLLCVCNSQNFIMYVSQKVNEIANILFDLFLINNDSRAFTNYKK